MKRLLLLVLAAACLACAGMWLPRGDGAVRAGPVQPANPARSMGRGEGVTKVDWFDQIFRDLGRGGGIAVSARSTPLAMTRSAQAAAVRAAISGRCVFASATVFQSH